MKRLRVCRLATVPFFLKNHLRSQICATVAAGHEVTLICSNGPEVSELRQIPGIRVETIEIPRQISPFKDLAAIWRLYRHFRREHYDIVHSTTPKAGMLSAVAGCLAGIPIRLHTFTGQVWMEKRGVIRLLAKWGDKVTARFATQCYADSQSQWRFIIEEAVAEPGRVKVLGKGSLAGVDVEKFEPQKWASLRQSIRAECHIASEAQVITFIGRLTRDKGLDELVQAFQSLRAGGLDCVLLLVGPRETDWSTLANETRQSIEQGRGIVVTGYSAEPERFLAITDLFCLPSYREGFGNVVIEAAAMGVPAVGTDIVGLRDSILAGETGCLVPAKDAASLAEALRDLLNSPARREEMGRKARIRALQDYDARKVNQAVLDEYLRLAGSGG